MDVRTKVLSALRWTATARLFGQLASWAITIFVIRILSPADYGLMAMAAVIMSFLYLINNLGLDAVLIHKESISEQTKRQVFGITIILNLAIFLLLYFSASWVAGFYAEPGLVLIIQVLAIQFIFLVFETLPQSKLERELDFKQRSIVDFATMVVGSITSLSMALSGMGVWSLVIGHLANIGTRMIGLNYIAPCWCWPSFSLRGMRGHLRFSSLVSTDRMLWWVFAETDKFVGGKILGKELLGIYAVANHLASLPINKIAGLINSVAFPAFSRVQDQPERIKSYFLKALRTMSVVAFPVFLGIASTSEDIVLLFLGEKWAAAALPLMILGLVMPIRMLSTTLPPVLWGTGKPSVSAGNYLIAAIAMPVAFVVGANWGVVGLAMAWLFAYPLVFAISLYRTAKAIGVTVRDFSYVTRGPAFAAITMFALVMVLKGFAIGTSGQIIHLLQLAVLGAFTYLGVLFMVDKFSLTETIGLLRS